MGTGGRGENLVSLGSCGEAASSLPPSLRMQLLAPLSFSGGWRRRKRAEGLGGAARAWIWCPAGKVAMRATDVEIAWYDHVRWPSDTRAWRGTHGTRE